jgi:predicted small secreted protein
MRKNNIIKSVKSEMFNLIVTCEFFIIIMFQGGNEMKKALVGLLAIAMLAVTLTGCTPEKTYKYGVGIDIKVTGASAVPAAGEVAAKDGNYAVNTDIVTVVLDKDNKVVSATWDVAQSSRLNFDVTGMLKVNLATYSMKTKLQKGTEYGMSAACQTGQICKEWNVQSKFFTDYLVGKTVAQVKAIEMVDGYPKDAAIKAGTTVHISGFFPAFNKAVANTVVIK